jgi:hypothetical protein
MPVYQCSKLNLPDRGNEICEGCQHLFQLVKQNLKPKSNIFDSVMNTVENLCLSLNGELSKESCHSVTLDITKKYDWLVSEANHQLCQKFNLC